jgi:hypothetical protein
MFSAMAAAGEIWEAPAAVGFRGRPIGQSVGRWLSVFGNLLGVFLRFQRLFNRFFYFSISREAGRDPGSRIRGFKNGLNSDRFLVKLARF